MSLYEAAGAEYLRRYYELGVWKRQHYRGVRILKAPTDLWNYQEIISERGIDWVIETGTRHGGSALYFADLLELNGMRGKVITIDVIHDELQVSDHPRIEFIAGNSATPEMVAMLRTLLPADRGPVFMILDSDHRMPHVLLELQLLTPLLRSGDYLVVEDTCINGHPVRPDFGPGPMEALESYLVDHGDEFDVDSARAGKFGFTAAPRGYLSRR